MGRWVAMEGCRVQFRVTAKDGKAGINSMTRKVNSEHMAEDKARVKDSGKADSIFSPDKDKDKDTDDGVGSSNPICDEM